MYSLRKETMSPLRSSNNASTIKSLLNYLYASPLGIDSSADGISEGWLTTANNPTTFSIDESGQKIEITANGGNTSSSGLRKIFSCSFGNIVTITASAKKLGNVTIYPLYVWSGGGVVFPTPVENETYQTLTYTAIAPAGTSSVEISLRVAPKAVGNVGSAWFKNAKLNIRR